MIRGYDLENGDDAGEGHESDWIDLGGVVVRISEIAYVEEVDSGYAGPDRTVAMVFLRNGEKVRVQYNREPSYRTIVGKLK